MVGKSKKVMVLPLPFLLEVYYRPGLEAVSCVCGVLVQVMVSVLSRVVCDVWCLQHYHWISHEVSLQG